MKNFMKKIAIILTLAMVLTLCLTFVGCGDKDEQTDFEFTEETIAKINNKELSDKLIKYCNDFYKHFQIECEQKLYIENKLISSTVASNLQNEMQQNMLPTILLGESEAREIVKFYLPFQELGAIRAQEYLDIKYDWVWVDGELKPTNPSSLTQKYINGINKQFEILKESYFKK